MANIWPEAVVFHRNKDGSLIELLRRNMKLSAPGNFIVVLPFCNLDALQLLKNLDWMKRLGTPKSHDCLLSVDRGTNNEIGKLLSKHGRFFAMCIPLPITFHMEHASPKPLRGSTPPERARNFIVTGSGWRRTRYR